MPKSSKQPVDESSKALCSAIYSFLKENNFSSTAKSLLKEASLDANASSDDSLSEIFSSYLVAKKKSVIKEESSDSSSSSSDSSSSDDSDSDDKKKAVPATNGTKKAPVAESSDSSDDDSSDEEEEVKAPVKTVAKKEESSDDSSSSDSDSDSSEDEKPVAKKAAVATKKVESSDSDSNSSDSSEDEAPVKAAATKRKAESSSDSSSSSDSDSDEEEEEVKKPAAKKVRVETPAAAAADASDGESFVAVVRGLPWSAGEDEVRGTFSGNIVEVELPLDDSGRSSGMAVITFGSRADLDAALAMDGQNFPGSERWMKVTEGRPSRKSVGSAPSSGEKPEGCDTVFVGNLPWDVTEEQMHELFAQCGEVAKVRFATSQEDGSFRGFGHVQFVDGDSTDAAVQMYGTDVNGRAIRVDYAPPRNRESLGGGGRGGRESFGSPRAGGRGDGGRGDGGRGRGRGDGGRGRGRGGSSFGTPTAAGKNKGAIAASSGKKTTFD